MSTAGQAAGYVIGGVVGAAFPAVGWVIGAQIGGMIGGYIDPPKGANTVGPRLEDLTVQTSTYGAVLPRIKGTIAVTGNVFWLEGDKIKEHEKTEKVGGKGGPTSKQTTFSYTATFAVGLSQQVAAPIAGIRRLWLANTLVYDAGSGDINSIIASNQQAGVMFKVYDGSDDQRQRQPGKRPGKRLYLQRCRRGHRLSVANRQTGIALTRRWRRGWHRQLLRRHQRGLRGDNQRCVCDRGQFVPSGTHPTRRSNTSI